jgi:hypothetical protein
MFKNSIALSILRKGFSTCVSLGTNTRERMNVCRIFGVVVWHFMLDVSGKSLN